MFGSLYREMSKLGLSPREVDEMEIWEAAAILGVGEDPLALETAPGEIPPDLALLAARVKAARGEAPPPEATPADPSLIAQALSLGGQVG